MKATKSLHSSPRFVIHMEHKVDKGKDFPFNRKYFPIMGYSVQFYFTKFIL